MQKTLLILLLLFFSRTIEAQPYSMSKILYIEGVIYRSKVEGTSKYYKKFQVVDIGAFEKTPNSGIKEQLDKLDNLPSRISPLIDLLGFAPGPIGKGAKGIKLFDMTNKALSKNSKVEMSEANFREFLSTVYDKASVDKDYAIIVNTFMQGTFGDITGSPEDILKSYPPFSDHNKLEQFTQLLSKKDLTDAKIETLIKDLSKDYSSYIDAQIKKQRDENNYQASVAKVEEFSTYGILLRKLIGLKNAELGRTVQIITQTFEKVALTLLSEQFSKMSAMAATGNLAIIALDLITALTTGPPPEQLILSAISDLQNLIINISKDIFVRFDIIDEKLNDIFHQITIIYQDVANNKEAITSLHQKVDDIQKRLSLSNEMFYNALKDGFERDLVNLVSSALNYKDIFKPGEYFISKDNFAHYVNELFTYATKHSTDGVAIPTGRNFDIDKIGEELNMYSVSGNLPYIRTALIQNGHVTLPASSVNVETWALATRSLLELISDWPKYQYIIRPTMFQELINKGEEIQNFLTACRYANNNIMYENLLKQIEAEENEYISKVSARIKLNLDQDFFRTNRIIGTVNFDSLYTASLTRLNNLFNNFTIEKIPITSNFSYYDAAGPKSTLIRPNLTVLIPSFVKLLHHLNLIDLTADFDYHENLSGGPNLTTVAKRNGTMNLTLRSKDSIPISFLVLKIKFDTTIIRPGLYTPPLIAVHPPWEVHANSILENNFMKPHLIQTGDMDSIIAKFFPYVSQYVNSIVAKSIKEEMDINDGKLNSKTANGLFELFQTGLLLGHPEKLSVPNDFEKQVINQIFINPDGELPGIMQSFSILGYKRQLSEFIKKIKTTMETTFSNLKIAGDNPMTGNNLLDELKNAKRLFEQNLVYRYSSLR